MTHALEVVDHLEWDRLVLGAAGLLEKVFVGGKIGVGEVKVDLSPDLVGIVALWKCLILRLDVAPLVLVSAIVVVSVVVGTLARARLCGFSDIVFNVGRLGVSSAFRLCLGAVCSLGFGGLLVSVGVAIF